MPPKRAKKQAAWTAVKEVRRRFRASLGPLIKLRAQPRTIRKYQEALLAFVWFTTAYLGQPLGSEWPAVDAQLCTYIEYLWSAGEAKALAANAISATQFFTLTRRMLPGAWILLTTWGLHESAERVPPLLQPLLLAMVARAFELQRPDVAGLLLAGWSRALRTMEFLSIKAGDVYVGPNGLGALRLPNTKTGKRDGLAEEWVPIEDPRVGAVLNCLAAGLAPEAPLLRGSAVAFRVLFEELLAFFGVATWASSHIRCAAGRRRPTSWRTKI